MQCGDALHGGNHLLAVQRVPALAVHAQFLGALGHAAVVLLQLVFFFAGGFEAAHAMAARHVLGDAAKHHSAGGDQEQHPIEHGQVAQATQGHGQRDDQLRQAEGEVAHGVDVVGQHRDQAMAAVAFQLLDWGAEYLAAQRDAQARDHLLANVIGADVRGDGAARASAHSPAKPSMTALAIACSLCIRALILASSAVTLRPPTIPSTMETARVGSSGRRIDSSSRDVAFVELMKRPQNGRALRAAQGDGFTQPGTLAGQGLVQRLTDFAGAHRQHREQGVGQAV